VDKKDGNPIKAGNSLRKKKNRRNKMCIPGKNVKLWSKKVLSFLAEIFKMEEYGEHTPYQALHDKYIL